MGISGDRENQIKHQAKHSDMCRSKPAESMDSKNYDYVEGNFLEKSLQLGKKSRCSVDRLSRTSVDAVGSTLSADTSLVAAISDKEVSASHEPACLDLERRLHGFRGATE